MLQHFFGDGPWFEPKRIGYGAGLPIVWQGWVFLAVHTAVILGTALWLSGDPVALVIVCLSVALVPLPIYARRTRDGWKWRSGTRD